MRKVVHYLLTFGDWIAAKFWRSALLMSVVLIIILVAG
jgi:hypothetical protein